MFKDKQFRVRPVSEVLDDLRDARRMYRRVDRIFLADGDALVLKTSELVEILDEISSLFPECGRVGIYGSPQDVLRKGEADLALLRSHGLGIVYIGAESGSDEVLRRVQKGATASEIIQAVNTIESSGVNASVTFISGLGGRELWEEHAVKTGEMISACSPSYAGLLTLMTEPLAPITQEIKDGKFELLSPEEVLSETSLLLSHTDVARPCVFRSNHASNYVNLKGTLPADKDVMIAQLEYALRNENSLKPEWMRAL
jgi:radical SAM superfamily enzyme YgiQ (UPF0313 family)